MRRYGAIAVRDQHNLSKVCVTKDAMCFVTLWFVGKTVAYLNDESLFNSKSIPECLFWRSEIMKLEYVLILILILMWIRYQAICVWETLVND